MFCHHSSNMIRNSQFSSFVKFITFSNSSFGSTIYFSLPIYLRLGNSRNRINQKINSENLISRFSSLILSDTTGLHPDISIVNSGSIDISLKNISFSSYGKNCNFDTVFTVILNNIDLAFSLSFLSLQDDKNNQVQIFFAFSYQKIIIFLIF